MGATSRPAAGVATRRTGRLRRFWESTIGKKIVMAVSGAAGIGFVLLHMAGNLQMFMPTGAGAAMHTYAVNLRKLGALLWVARVGLLAAVVLHVVAAVQLTARNRDARPVAYSRRKSRVSTLSSRTMRVGGFILVGFIVFHILDMTVGVWHPRFTHLDPYNNLRIGLQRWWVALFYVISVVFLGLHLFHGAWASWRTLGLRRPGDRPLHRSIAIVLAVLITLGMGAIPVAGALGLFPEEPPPVPRESADVSLTERRAVVQRFEGEP